MDVNDVTVVVTDSQCDFYAAGDEITFDGPLIDREKSGCLCMTALQAIYPFVFAARQGAVWDHAIQCPDCAERVTFAIKATPHVE